MSNKCDGEWLRVFKERYLSSDVRKSTICMKKLLVKI